MKELPDIQEGLDRLAGVNKEVLTVVDTIKTAKEAAQEASDNTPALTSSEAVKRIRDELISSFETEKIGHLISDYHIDRSAQMQTLQAAGKHVILDVMAQGVLPADLAKALKVSYATFHEYLRITCNEDELNYAESLAADNLVAEGIRRLERADDMEDISKAKALMDVSMKLAKSMTTKYTERKPQPQTAVQINHTEHHHGAGHPSTATATSNIFVVPDKDDLPELKKHRFTADRRGETFKPEGFIDGEFTLYDGGESAE